MSTTPARVHARPSQAKWWKVCWMYGDRQLYGRSNAICPGLDRGRNQNKSQLEVPEQYGQFTPPKPNLLRQEPLQDLQNYHEDDGGFIALQYSWVPPGLIGDEIRQYFSALPKAKVPFVDSLGERYRVHQLLRQMPPQDNEARCTRLHQLSEEERSELRLITIRVRESSGRGKAVRVQTTSQCQSCNKRLSMGDMSVFASRAGPNSCWHPACFVCSICQELLVDLIYFYREGKVYCGRHYAETLKPRCPACDELILTEEQVKAEGCTWHMKHFACLECDQQLGGQRYIMRDGHPYCFTCFHTMFAEYCDSCGEPIGIDQGQMSHKDQHWHATYSCFCCYMCKTSLLGRPFLPFSGHIYCSRNCSRENSSSVTRKQDEGMNCTPQNKPNHPSLTLDQHNKNSCFNSEIQNSYLTNHKPITSSDNSSRVYNQSLFKRKNSVEPFLIHKEPQESGFSGEYYMHLKHEVANKNHLFTSSHQKHNKAYQQFSKNISSSDETKIPNYEIIDENFVRNLFENNHNGKYTICNSSSPHLQEWTSETNLPFNDEQIYNVDDTVIHDEVEKWLAEREKHLSSTSNTVQTVSNLQRPQPPESPQDSGHASSVTDQQSPTPTLNYSESLQSKSPDLTLQSHVAHNSSYFPNADKDLNHFYAHISDLRIADDPAGQKLSGMPQITHSTTNLEVEKWLSKGVDTNGTYSKIGEVDTTRLDNHSFSTSALQLPSSARSKKSLSVRFEIVPQQPNLSENSVNHHSDQEDSASTCSTCSTSSSSDDSTIYQIPHETRPYKSTRISYVPNTSSITVKKPRLPPNLSSSQNSIAKRKCDIS